MILRMLIIKPVTFSKFISLAVQSNPKHLLDNSVKTVQIQVTSLPFLPAHLTLTVFGYKKRKSRTRQDAGFFSHKRYFRRHQKATVKIIWV